MPEKTESIKIAHYLGLVFKHRWLLIIPFCIAMVAGMYLAIKLPKIYETSALVLVTAQRVPSNYVQSIVTSDINSRIDTISQQILSRSNLGKIIKKYNLFSEPKFSSMLLESKVAMFRQHVKVKVNTVRGPRSLITNGFSITVKGSYPEKVMNITNGLAGSFIKENLRIREVQSVGTSDFLSGELLVMQKRLEEVEQNLRNYRRQYMGELPEQLNANLSFLERLQMQLSEKEESLRDEKSRLAVIENQIDGNRKILAENRVTGTVSDEGDEVSLELLKAQLITLRSNYTDRHPDVIKLKAKIADLEAQYPAGEPASSGESQTNVAGDPALQLVSNTLNELARQRIETRGEIENLEREIAQINNQMRNYQERVERTPQREQELMSLKRDYENIQESYESLLNRKLEAEHAVNMEKKQKSEQFHIVEHAALPRTPVSPDIKKLFMMSVAAGLGLGAGLIFLLDFMNTSLKQPKDYESQLGLAVLATIPKLLGPKDKLWRRLNQGLTAISLVFAAALTAGFGLIVLKGVEPMMELVSKYVKI